MSAGDAFSVPSSIGGFPQEQNANPNPKPDPTPAVKKKRNLPGTPDPDAEVIALSPKTLMATNRFICEICNKGFQRDQNLQLHRRGHNLPWKLRQRTNKEVRKKVYICPEKTCVHHDASRALGDLTGIKKHFSRKHGEKKWKCEKCSKKYAVQSDWKAHSKTCGTREYKCDCGTLFSRKDSFITHRAFCDALADESARLTSLAASNLSFRSDSSLNETVINPQAAGLPHGLSGRGVQDAAGICQFRPGFRPDFNGMAIGNSLGLDQQQKPRLSLWLNHPNEMVANSHLYASSSSTGFPDMVQAAPGNALFGSSSIANFGNFNEFEGFDKSSTVNPASANASLSLTAPLHELKEGGNKGNLVETLSSLYSDKQSKPPGAAAAPMSATALLQKAAQMGSTRSNNPSQFGSTFGVMSSSSSNPSSFINNAINQNRNDHQLHQVFQNAKQQQQAENFAAADGMLGSKSFDQLMMQASGKQSEAVPVKHHQSSPTRDFLGMGGRESQRPFLPQELAKFTSIGSSMGLSQFTGNH